MLPLHLQTYMMLRIAKFLVPGEVSLELSENLSPERRDQLCGEKVVGLAFVFHGPFKAAEEFFALVEIELTQLADDCLGLSFVFFFKFFLSIRVLSERSPHSVLFQFFVNHLFQSCEIVEFAAIFEEICIS